MKLKIDQRFGFILVAIFAIFGLFFVQSASIKPGNQSLKVKLRASQLASQSFKFLASERAARGLPFYETDRGKTGLIGPKISSITSDRGYLRAKIASLNPNFAALIVDWLEQIEVKQGDVVAVALSGSFPALNICVFSALRAMNLKPMIITSATGSNWGANDPDFCWLDMEQSLYEAKLLPFRSHLVSLGGDGDCGRGLTKEGLDCLENKICASGLTQLRCENTRESVAKRLAFYKQNSQPRPIKAYINVGGGIASVSQREKHLFRPGLNRSTPPIEMPLPDSIMMRYSREKIPLIHLVMVRQLAQQYQLRMPVDGVPSAVGVCSVYNRAHPRYSFQSAMVVLLGLLIGLRSLSLWPRDSSSSKRQASV